MIYGVHKIVKGSFRIYDSSSCITIFLDGNFKSEGWMQGSCCSTLQHTIYVSCIHISNPNIFIEYFATLSGNGRHCPLSAARTNAIIYARAAQTEVGGASVRGPLGS